ncbi:cadmium-translocating P-type ATPase [Pseudoflavonifractor sp. SW1122]|uniref:heavy metal translocating P-type ATPase n=1 Tax=Pseudoflavonifractor sp. SW1122 TaxID=2530044 RepID=UPI00143BFBD3|nr:heavy metal translocating P-type ATPase [Pseudoflavonifractor sp. SW1122]NJE74566.1 cadmium-translocating P-type ATPase [Pseudoflavonifractor sp. SW1122]
MTRRHKQTLARILVAGVLLIAAVLTPQAWGLWRLPIFLIPYFVVGWDVLWEAICNIAHGEIFDENFLMCVATLGALVLGEYAEAVGVMLFYQVGELFQSLAVNKSRRSIAQLMDIRPDSAHVLRGGEEVTVDPDEVQVGETLVVRPGERIALDGVVVEGSSSLDTAALTGESMPRDVEEGQEVSSGCVNLTGLLHIEVSRPFGQSTVARILELVENAAAKKAKAEHFITRFARWYTPVVVLGAAALAIVGGLVTGHWGEWVRRALIFLVISCPCALVISIPMAFFGGIGGASRQGVLVKGGNYLELLAKTRTVVFDKTGTLTQGKFALSGLYPVRDEEEEPLLRWAALAESHSNHPIAQSLRRAWQGDVKDHTVTDVEEIPGRGVCATVDGVEVLAGNAVFLSQHGFTPAQDVPAGTVVHVAAQGRYLGFALIADQVKDHAAKTIAQLKQQGVRTVMLTGDSREVGEQMAQRLGLDQVHAQLLPQDKVDQLEQLLEQKPEGTALAYVGDGVNDAPVLSRADVGVAMGGMGSDAAIEAADVVLMDDDPAKLLTAMSIARKCRAIVIENIVFALGVKGLFLAMGAFGVATMWEAVFADVGVAVIAILNASRMLYHKKST